MEKEKEYRECGYCNGKGKTRHWVPAGKILIPVFRVCYKCNGKGKKEQ